MCALDEPTLPAQFTKRIQLLDEFLDNVLFRMPSDLLVVEGTDQCQPVSGNGYERSFQVELTVPEVTNTARTVNTGTRITVSGRVLWNGPTLVSYLDEDLQSYPSDTLTGVGTNWDVNIVTDRKSTRLNSSHR